MPTITLAEVQKLVQDDLVAGIAEDVITVNPIYDVLPFTSFAGTGLTVNRENTLGDVEYLDIGDTITAKAAGARTQVTHTPTTILGDAEINNLEMAMSGAGKDQANLLAAIEISSKAKSLARKMQSGIYLGDPGATPVEINSLHAQVDASQYTTASAGQALSFALLDELLDLVKAKDGEVDWIMMNATQIRKYKVLLRALGGTPADWVVTLPGGRKVISYEGIPIFRNDWITHTETANGAAVVGGALTSAFAGVWDDGSKKVGCSMIYPEATPAGIMVDAIGQMEAKDQAIYRVKWYGNFAIFNRRGVARLTSLQ